MEHLNKKSSNESYIKLLIGRATFGFIISFLLISLYYLSSGEVLCTAIENIMSPNLMFVMATISLSLHALSIFFSCLRKTANEYYYLSSELAVLLVSSAMSLSTFYYLYEFGFSYNPILLKLLPISLIAFLYFFSLTLLPFIIFVKYKIGKDNFKSNKTNVTITLAISIIAMICILFTLTGAKIPDLSVCS